MAGKASLDEKLASRDFVTDFLWAARTVFAQPSVALVSIAVWVLPVLLNRAELQGRHPVVVTVGTLLVCAFWLGWLGVERVFFRRRREGERVALSELLADVPFFIGRFLRLALLVGMAVTPLFFVYGYLVARHNAAPTDAGASRDTDRARDDHGAARPRPHLRHLGAGVHDALGLAGAPDRPRDDSPNMAAQRALPSLSPLWLSTC